MTWLRLTGYPWLYLGFAGRGGKSCLAQGNAPTVGNCAMAERPERSDPA